MIDLIAVTAVSRHLSTQFDVVIIYKYFDLILTFFFSQHLMFIS